MFVGDIDFDLESPGKSVHHLHGGRVSEIPKTARLSEDAFP